MGTFNGGAGNDQFVGDGSGDIASGNGGDDQLHGNGGDDDLAGGAGADTITGGDGRNVLFSAERYPHFGYPYSIYYLNNPILDTGTEADTLTGGIHEDYIFAGVNDNIDGGAGTDYLYLSMLGATSGVSLDFTQAVLNNGTGTIRNIEGVEWLQGSNFDDYIRLRSTTDYGAWTVVYAMGGNDHVIADYKTDALFGGDGNDVLDGRGSGYIDMIDGGSGEDLLYLQAYSSARAYGHGGNDVMHANGFVDGGDGDDIIYRTFTYYASTIDGGAGTDTLSYANYEYGALAVSLSEGAGSAGKGGYGEAVVNVENLHGSVFADTLTGSDGANIIHGGGGNDVVNGRLGADTLRGEEGDDLFTFTSVASGPAGSSLGLIDGGAGYDTIDFRNIAPVILGTIETAPGTYALGAYVGSQKFEIRNVDLILFGSGNDTIHLPPSHVAAIELRGGAGDDSLWGAGAARLFGEEGDDSFFISGSFGTPSTNGLIDGGSGIDRLQLNVLFTVDLAAGTAVSGSARFQISSIEEVEASVGGGAGSKVSGSGAAERFTVNPLFDDGSAGVHFEGRGGDDILTGSAGDDLIDGGAGADKMVGAAGNDIYVVADTNDLVVETEGGGTDLVRTSRFEYTLEANVENLEGIGSAQTLTGNDLANAITGSDTDDKLRGLAGDDMLVGGAGNDLLIGGTGDDVYVVEGADTVTELAGEGTDEIRTALGSPTDFAQMYTLADNVENLTGTSAAGQGVYGNALDNVIAMGAGGDLVVLEGGGNDVVSGGGGDDFLYWGAAFTNVDKADGGSGFDTVGLLGAAPAAFDADDLVSIEKLAVYSSGNAAAPNSYSLIMHDGNVASGQQMMVVAQSLMANEVLTFNGAAETDGSFNVRGGRGADTITGGGKGDMIWGGLGADTLRGGVGNDVFQYEAAGESKFGAADVILDFAKGDRINLSPIDADGNAANGDSKFTWLGAGAFTGQAGQLRVTQHPQNGQAWVVEADVNGDGAADFTLYFVAPAGFVPEKSDFYV